MIKPDIFQDPKFGWCARIVVGGLPRTFSAFSSKTAAARGAELQLAQYAKTGNTYTQLELRQLGLCGETGSYDRELKRRRSIFGVVNLDGSVRRCV